MHLEEGFMEQKAEQNEQGKRFVLEDFDGPLDVLLFLIKKNEVNIYDIPIAQITEQFLEYFYFEKVYDRTRLMVNYEDYEKDASLKGEFVRTVMGEKSFSEEDKKSIIRYGLQAIAGEEIR